MSDDPKRAVGRRAAELVEDGMAVGLGTGSTVTHLIDALIERSPAITCVATSLRSERQAREGGLAVVGPDAVDRLDLTIDGADEVDGALNLIKGGGGAHVREKIVAQMASRFVVIVDQSKLVATLGDFGLPIEVLPFAPETVARALVAAGAQSVTAREDLSDNGNPLLDADFGAIEDPDALATRLERVPGLVGHGIFRGDLVDRVLVDGPDGPQTLTRGAPGDGPEPATNRR